MAAEKVNYHIDEVPIEMWNEIFQYTNTKNDLKYLSLVCKSFYERIGMLPEAMDRLVLQLHGKMKPEDRECILLSARNYNKMKITNVNEIGVFSEILEDVGPKLKFLKISNCTLPKSQLMKILEVTGSNLKTLHLEKLYEDRSGEPSPPATFKIAHLENLKLYQCKDYSILDALPNNIQMLSYTPCSWKSDNCLQGLKTFIEAQTSLKHLRINLKINSHQDERHLQMFYGEHMKFRLESLEITCTSSFLMNGLFKSFLKLHSPTLKNLMLMNIHFNHCLNELDFSQLKKLTINMTHPCCVFDDERFYVKTLLAKPEEIYIKSNVNIMYADRLSQHCLNLKKLTFEFFDDFFFCSIKFDAVEELVIENLRKDVVDHMLMAFQNLKILKLKSKAPIKSSIFVFILANLKALEHLEIEDGSKLNIFFIANMTNLLGNLKYLKICNLQEPVDDLRKHFEDNVPQLKFYITQTKIEPRVEKEHDYCSIDADYYTDDYEDFSSSDDMFA